MMPYDTNWERWCKISIIKHLESGIHEQMPNVEVYVEGFDRKTEKESHYVEIRIDGPFTRPTVREQFHLHFEVNCLICVRLDNSADRYLINRLTALVAGKLLTGICVYKFGDGPDDDANELLGYLALKTQGRDLIQTTHFGILQNVRLTQATVEAHYKISLD